MDNPLFLLLLSGLTTAFMAVIVSATFKRFSIPNHPDTFKQTLKFGLLGGLVGMIIFFVTWYSKKQESNSWEAPGIIATIPFFVMLVGQLLGVYQLNRMKK
jgi:drug/metabolite transporter (DMT)-like permease